MDPESEFTDELEFTDILTGEDAELPSEQLEKLMAAQQELAQQMQELGQQLIETQAKLAGAVEGFSHQLDYGHVFLGQQVADMQAEIAKRPKGQDVIKDVNGRVTGSRFVYD